MRGLVSSLDDARCDSAAMREWHRVLRPGGRVMTIEAGAASGIKGLAPTAARQRGVRGVWRRYVGALEAAGFRPVRMLAEREGYRFAEGIKA